MGIVRKTKSVNTLLTAFKQSNRALSVIELINMFDDQMNKTTVYRILDRLEDDGTLHSFTGKGGLKWYAKCKSCTSSNHIDTHPHFQCWDCGKAECLSMDVFIPAVPKRQIDFAQLLLIGKCEECLA